jgi:uncharacterized membrane protein YfcA
MELTEAAVLFVAGLAAGSVNAVAGGGSLITFPTLVAVGLPPVAANVSNSIAVCPGYLAAVAGSRADLSGQRRRLLRLLPTVVVGTAAGCALLLVTPQRAFELVVPFLVLAAAAILAFQERLRRLAGRPRSGHVHLVVGLGAVYGGYFGAALGVMLVAALALVLDETLPRISAAKNVISAVVGLVTIVSFAAFGPVNWATVAVLAPATLIGGYVGARLARRLPPRLWRAGIVTFGAVIGLWLLVRALA